ncbi:tripartite motif-containing protein 10-like [Amblyraja radiata]|uniref:tripartite motif-containing protein 10-like n=1 Tax=Amblyraja radiata TaxID=386614 RepID=UPI001403625B|nr:tripartite motif-containing protein 10-like [Amblyraja radiata]
MKVICLICRDAREHKSHSFIPIEEAVEIYKEQVKSSFESLTKKKSEIEQMEQEQKEKISVVLEASHNLQSQTTSQFADLVIDEAKPMLLVDGALPIEKFALTFFHKMALRETSDIIKRGKTDTSYPQTDPCCRMAQIVAR